MEIKQRDIDLREVQDFCDDYDSIRFGKATLVETPNNYIVELYNAGFSENEEMDADFRKKYPEFIIYDSHPVTIAVFKKVGLFHRVVNFENLDILQVDVFKYEIEIE